MKKSAKYKILMPTSLNSSAYLGRFLLGLLGLRVIDRWGRQREGDWEGRHVEVLK